MVLAKLALAEGEEDFDEEAIGRCFVDDDDRFGGVGVESLGGADGFVEVSGALEAVAEGDDVHVVGAAPFVFRVDAGGRELFARGEFNDGRRVFADEDLAFGDDDEDAVFGGFAGHHGRGQTQVIGLGDGAGGRSKALEEEDEDDRHQVEHCGDVEEVDLGFASVFPLGFSQGRFVADEAALFRLSGRLSGAHRPAPTTPKCTSGKRDSPSPSLRRESIVSMMVPYSMFGLAVIVT